LRVLRQYGQNSRPPHSSGLLKARIALYLKEVNEVPVAFR
jgi:hypothetical protein